MEPGFDLRFKLLIGEEGGEGNAPPPPLELGDIIEIDWAWLADQRIFGCFIPCIYLIRQFHSTGRATLKLLDRLDIRGSTKRAWRELLRDPQGE